jgi:hypothetical protein
VKACTKHPHRKGQRCIERGFTSGHIIFFVSLFSLQI